MTKEEFKTKYKEIKSTGVTRDLLGQASKQIDDLKNEYIQSNAKYAVGDKLKYNNCHRLSRYTFLTNTITIGFVYNVDVWCGDSIFEFGTITYGMSECFKNGKEKSLRNGYILIPETDIIEKQ